MVALTEKKGDVDQQELWPPRARGGLDPRRPGEFADQLARLRRAALTQPDRGAHSSLQILDLQRLRGRLGERWPALRPKVLLNVERCVSHHLKPEELYLVADETTVLILALGQNRADVERRGQLIAAEVSGRLLGVQAGGGAVGVRTLPFDFDEGLRAVAGIRGLLDRVRGRTRDLAQAEQRAFSANEPKLMAFYRPILSLRVPKVVGYRVFARLPGPDGALLRPETACPDRALGDFDAALDGWLAERIAVELARPGAAARRALLVLPVHQATLTDPARRREWLARLGGAPPDSAPRLAVDLLDLPATTPHEQIAELAHGIAGRVGRVMLRCPPDGEAVRQVACPSLFALSVDVRELGTSDADSSARLAAFAQACAAAGLRSLAVQVGSAAQAELVRAAGIDYLAGDACLPPLRAPGSVVELTRG